MEPFTRKITTRGYELDSESLIPPATVLRYCEHLRWLSVAAQAAERDPLRDGEVPEVGHILGSLFGDGYSLVVVAQTLVLEGDVGQGVALEASMWVRRVGRTSLDFGHLLTLPDGSPLARALVVAVYRGPDGKPLPVPESVRQQVTADPVSFGALVSLAQATSDPAAPEPARAWTREVEVRPSDIDLLGHMNHANYLSLFDDTRRLAARAGALEPAAGGRLASAKLVYRQQAVVGDPLVARVWPASDDGLGADLTLDLQARGALLAQARLTLR